MHKNHENIIDFFHIFQGFEARGTEIRGRQRALDNLASEANNYSSPYSIVLQDKNFNYNTKLFGKPPSVYDTRIQRRKRNVKSTLTEFEKAIRKEEPPIKKSNSSENYRNDNAKSEDDRDFRKHDNFADDIQHTRYKRQTQHSVCKNRWFGKFNSRRKV